MAALANKVDGGSTCPDCGASPGSPHVFGCDVEPCPSCGHQYISCGCEPCSEADCVPWGGEWPGLAECREFGWYLPAKPGEAEEREDLNRLHAEAVWDRRQRKFVLPTHEKLETNEFEQHVFFVLGNGDDVEEAWQNALEYGYQHETPADHVQLTGSPEDMKRQIMDAAERFVASLTFSENQTGDREEDDGAVQEMRN